MASNGARVLTDASRVAALPGDTGAGMLTVGNDVTGAVVVDFGMTVRSVRLTPKQALLLADQLSIKALTVEPKLAKPMGRG